MDQRRLRQTVSAAIKFEPHVVVTVDAKGFSFRVLRSLTGNDHSKIHLMGRVTSVQLRKGVLS